MLLTLSFTSAAVSRRVFRACCPETGAKSMPTPTPMATPMNRVDACDHPRLGLRAEVRRSLRASVASSRSLSIRATEDHTAASVARRPSFMAKRIQFFLLGRLLIAFIVKSFAQKRFPIPIVRRNPYRYRSGLVLRVRKGCTGDAEVFLSPLRVRKFGFQYGGNWVGAERGSSTALSASNIVVWSSCEWDRKHR